MAADTCCSAPGGDGLILLALILIGGFVYWWTSKWLVSEAKAASGHTIKVGKKEVKVRLYALYSLQVTSPGHPSQPWTDVSGVVHDGGAKHDREEYDEAPSKALREGRKKRDGKAWASTRENSRILRSGKDHRLTTL